MNKAFGILLVGLLLSVLASSDVAWAKNWNQKKQAVEKKLVLLLPKSEFGNVTAVNWLTKSTMPRAADKPMSSRDVSYILRKTGFEPSPSEVSQWVGEHRSTLITNLIDGLKTEPVNNYPAWTKLEPRYWGQNDWPESKRSAFRSARRQEVSELRQWWITQMLASKSPLAEKMVLFWENTFVAGFSGLDEKSHAQWMHHKTIRNHATGNYRELVHSMVKDPAVLIYLDNNRNERQSPNENLARELFELFTLGEGNYLEADIKEAAKALAGWHVSEFGKISFLEKSWARDFSEKEIFGIRKKFDGEGLVDLILRHQKASEFVVKRLWSEFVSLEPMPSEVLAHWSEAFRKTDYEISELLTIILNSSYFWDDKYRATSVKSPVELMVGMVRMAQHTEIPISVLDARLADMGQVLFDPPDVSGWGYGDYWIDAAKLIEREQFQDLFLRSLTDKNMEQIETKNSADISKLLKKELNAIKLKLAGEAYQGMPPYRVSIKHAGGKWVSDINYLQSARDTERLGRYEDESQWVWENISLDVPHDVKDIEQIGIRFVTDASGNGGDRNFFIGAVEWQGAILPGSLGIQAPGCPNDDGGKIRHPERLYCAGELTLDWKKLTKQVRQEQAHSTQKSLFETNELVLLWLKPPSEGKWQSIDLMFDNLTFMDRNWDYFGFKVVVDTERGNHFHIAFDEDRCLPSCFVRWPTGAWKDKLGLRHSVVSFNSADDWVTKQYFGLKKADKEFVKSIISLMPRITELVANTLSHREPDSKNIWMERMGEFQRFANMKRWTPKNGYRLVEHNASQSEATLNMNNMQSMMAPIALDDTKYTLGSGEAITFDEWHTQLETFLTLASEPLESWMLSHYEGERLTDLKQVVMSPYLNIK